jgi:putative SOS response-associated peptidase YedK
MCGRFLNKLPTAEIARTFGTRNDLPNYPERFNVAPTDPVLTVRFNPETKERSLARRACRVKAILTGRRPAARLASRVGGRKEPRWHGRRSGQRESR